MCRIEEGLRVCMAGLLAPVEVGLFCRLGDGGSQRLAFAGRRLGIDTCCCGCVADRIQGVGEGTRR
jgi:hypothetical protein